MESEMAGSPSCASPGYRPGGRIRCVGAEPKIRLVRPNPLCAMPTVQRGPAFMMPKGSIADSSPRLCKMAASSRQPRPFKLCCLRSPVVAVGCGSLPHTSSTSSNFIMCWYIAFGREDGEKSKKGPPREEKGRKKRKKEKGKRRVRRYIRTTMLRDDSCGLLAAMHCV